MFGVWVRGARNYTSTGFISMKHIDPATRYMENNTANTFGSRPLAVRKCVAV